MCAKVYNFTFNIKKKIMKPKLPSFVYFIFPKACLYIDYPIWDLFLTANVLIYHLIYILTVKAGQAVQNYFIPKPKKWLPITNTHHGLYLHKDHTNWSFGAILIFGCDINRFDQRYVMYALRLPCPGWSLVLGDYQHLSHAVRSGTTGLRFCWLSVTMALLFVVLMNTKKGVA